MAAGSWVLYNEAKLKIGNGVIKLGTDTFYIALFTSATNANAAALQNALLATLTNEVGTTNTGYATGGLTAGVGSWTGDYSTATKTFDIADVQWTAGSANLVAKVAVCYDFTAASKDLVAYFLLDSGGLDVTVTNGNILNIGVTNVYTWN